MSIEKYQKQWKRDRIENALASQSDFAMNNQPNEQIPQDLFANDTSPVADIAKKMMVDNSLDMSRSRDGEQVYDEQSSYNGTPYRGGMSGGSEARNSSPSSKGSGSYLDNLSAVESAGNWNAYNKGSGAFGKFQFIPSTEKAYAQKLGMTIPEARTPEGQMKMVSAFTNDNRKGLVNAGFEPTQENMYMAHNLGIGSALSALRGGSVKQKYLEGQGVSTVKEWRDKFSPRFS